MNADTDTLIASRRQPNRPTGVAILGCGSVSARYLRMLRHFSILEVLHCADLDPERAQRRVEEFGLGKPSTWQEVLDDPDVSIVVNLTPPSEHFATTEAALRAGKSVYVEKPLATDPEDARRLLALARESGLLLACAPDTVLGRGPQTAIAAVAAGEIGTPVHASASMLRSGPEIWHHDADFFYRPGAGPLHDMGPYYLSMLVHLLGPVTAVSAQNRISDRERVIARGPRAGERIEVATPTVTVASLDFASGAIATLVCSFDAWAATSPHIELHGTAGSLVLPDPNLFDGPVRIARPGGGGLQDLPALPGYVYDRGIGVADLALALRTGGVPKADPALALHVLDVMHAAFLAAERRTTVEVHSTTTRTEPMPTDLSVYGWTGIADPDEDARLAKIR
ncbi:MULTISPECIES: Gfo/Idh/MocA family protein [unclassified Streptomyces]|uniref:Gfo/Idh/MocA family protein n=1 Tax=unclassified Streptomyces TaxID=2593676 RepID=UPI0038109DB3